MRMLLPAALLLVSTVAQASPRLVVPADLSAPHLQAVRAEGLRPGTEAIIEVVRHGQDSGATYVARGRFTADARGRIDTARAAPREGTYEGADGLGLYWSGEGRAPSASDPAPGEAAISLKAGEAVLFSVTTRTGPDPAAITVSRDTPFPGAVWARPKSAGRHPVVIVLGGSEGGSYAARAMAPLFAARGYAVLGLPYYDPGWNPTDRLADLPHSFTEIPVDRLEAARDWIAGQPEADAGRIGLWGASKGAEFALIAASRYAWIKAVAAIVPTDVVWEGWGRAGPSTSSFALDGKPLAFQPYVGMDAELAKAARGEPMDLRKVHLAGRDAHPERLAAARIPVERYAGPLLLAGGGRDGVWPSMEMARNVAASRRSVKARTMLLTYPEAGHGLSGPGAEPARPLARLGGSPAAIAHARAETWAATFELFGEALRP